MGETREQKGQVMSCKLKFRNLKEACRELKFCFMAYIFSIKHIVIKSNRTDRFFQFLACRAKTNRFVNFKTIWFLLIEPNRIFLVCFGSAKMESFAQP